MTLRAAVVVYPGSNCDRDMFYALRYAGFDAFYVDLSDKLDDFDLIAIPGGFSYGDYLRPGAVAAREPITNEIKKRAKEGAIVFGICNGFQILLEAGLLEGALLQNKSGKFMCKWVEVEILDNNTAFTNLYKVGEVIRLPIANGFGRYVKTCDVKTVFKYTKDINGSDELIAGVINQQGNVLGLMPHPERAYQEIIGGKDGLRFFESIKNYLLDEKVIRGK